MTVPVHKRIKRSFRSALVRPTAACSAALEFAIRGHPDEWVWMHERRKTRPEDVAAEAPLAKPVPKTAELSSR